MTAGIFFNQFQIIELFLFNVPNESVIYKILQSTIHTVFLLKLKLYAASMLPENSMFALLL